jgi:hypothetical protein
MDILEATNNPQDCFKITDFSKPNQIHCSDCWRDQRTHGICTVLFYLYSILFAAILVIFFMYILKKNQSIKISKKGSSFSYIFAFMVCWVGSLVIWFTETFADYGFRTEIVITSVPIFFTFMIVVIVIYNLLEILSYFTTQTFWTSLKKFKILGGFCVLT